MMALWPVAVVVVSALTGGAAYLTSSGISDTPPDASSLVYLSGRAADMEKGDGSGFDKTEANGASLEVVTDQAYEGAYSAKATQTAPINSSYARGLFMGNWGDGNQVNYGAAVYFPRGFFAQQRGQVSLLRFDNYPDNATTTERVGLVLQSNHKLYLIRQKHPNQETLLGPFTVSEGKWNVLEVRQRLGKQQGALNAVYINGQLAGVNDKPNTYGNPFRRLRVGLVSSTAKQEIPLSLYFDDARVASL